MKAPAEWLRQWFELEGPCECGQGPEAHTVIQGPNGPLPKCAPRPSER